MKTGPKRDITALPASTARGCNSRLTQALHRADGLSWSTLGLWNCSCVSVFQLLHAEVATGPAPGDGLLPTLREEPAPRRRRWAASGPLFVDGQGDRCEGHADEVRAVEQTIQPLECPLLRAKCASTGKWPPFGGVHHFRVCIRIYSVHCSQRVAEFRYETCSRNPRASIAVEWFPSPQSYPHFTGCVTGRFCMSGDTS